MPNPEIPAVPPIVNLSREKFHDNLVAASSAAVAYTRNLVTDHLPTRMRFFIVRMPQGPIPREAGTVIFPESMWPAGDAVLDAREVVSALWRDGQVPVWINVQVAMADMAWSMLCLTCAERFSSDPTLMYHVHEGRAPFHVLSPLLPPGWEDFAAQGGKYPLNWQEIRHPGTAARAPSSAAAAMGSPLGRY
jgi:hypothetical protein